MLAALILAAATQAPPVRPCDAAQLSAAVESTSGKYTGMSHNGGVLHLKNVSRWACSVAETPKLEFYEANVTAPLAIERDDSFGIATARLTLRPGDSAYGVLRWVQNDVFQGGSCVSVASAGYVAGGDGKIVPLQFQQQMCGDARGPRFDWQHLTQTPPP